MRIEVATQLALEKRRQLQEQAMAMGVSEAYISHLVEEFYRRVRVHPELGPVFNDVVQDRWPEHLQRLKLFWTSVALRTGNYHGNPLPVHVALSNAKPEHFGIWLGLFEQTLQETAPGPEVVDYFMGFAKSIGARLSQAMFKPIA